ncbi:MAG: Gfo/Idh/MocA family oxidoreductase [Polyangiaceae bacterium]
MTSPSLRLGVLGAARIAPMALVRPAREIPSMARVVAVAARDPQKAQAFADKHGIPRVHRSYDELLSDPEIDAVYNPLPNSHHAALSIRALEAGKHVLCEKPLASNAEEAERMASAARAAKRSLVEAFHWRYHPLCDHVRAIVARGEIGAPRHYEVSLAIPMGFLRNDIRWSLALSGGALMDIGCYTVSMIRHYAGAEPSVERARALLWAPGVDRKMQASLRFADGRTAALTASMWSSTLVKAELRIEGEAGSIRVFNPIAPHFYHRVTIETRSGKRRERAIGAPAAGRFWNYGEATYTSQLRAFVEHVQHGAPVPTSAEDGVANMRVIDAIYRAAGLSPRGLDG